MFSDESCSRCGSPKKISKTWNETIEMWSGATSKVEISQIVCTNVECQAKFDKNRAEEVKRNDERKQKKEEQDKIRKENLVQSIAQARKNKIVKVKTAA